MHDEDTLHPNKSLQEKLEYIYQLRRAGDPKGRVNFEDNSNYLALLEAFGNPHLKLPPVIHLAGTNGKGSTLATLRAIYEAAGYKVHAYTSPHLKTFNERIYLAGQNIDDTALEELLDETFEKNKGRPVTFFEFTTSMAFAAFTRIPADVVLLETGMGGRLDCTNIIAKPAATIITQIAYDHMEFLGDTPQKIAGEKAGIMKEGVPCLLAPQQEDVKSVFQDKSLELDCPLYIAGEHWTNTAEGNGMVFQFSQYPKDHFPRPHLLGDHQIDNTGTAIATACVLNDRFPVKEEHIRTGLIHIHWPGRLEHITSGPLAELLPAGWELWFDGGHNPAAARVIATQLQHWQEEDGCPVHILLGMKEGKDIDGVREILEPHASSLTQTEIGQDLHPVIKQLVATMSAPAKILISGSFYSY